MGFRLFGTQASPIAIDFGTSSVKLLQTGLGDRPNLIAAAELLKPVDEDGRGDAEDFEYLAIELPRLLRTGGFKGRRVIFTVPGEQTMIQHLQLHNVDGLKREDAVKSQLQMQMNISPRNTVVRWIDVTEIHREGQAKTELICFAIPRDVVMGYVKLLEKLRLQVVGVQTEVQSMVRAFDHIHRRAGDDKLTTMYIDLGRSSSNVAMAHGKAITFARSIQIGGMHFDRLIAKQLSCDMVTAKAHRLAMENPVHTRSASPSAANHAGANAPANASTRTVSSDGEDGGGGFARLEAAMAKERAADTPDPSSRAVAQAGASQENSTAQRERRDRREGRFPAVLPSDIEDDETDRPDNASPVNEEVDLSDALDTITDELSMCLRYHRGLFPNRAIDRVILLGGEARQPWLCRHIVRSLRVPARLGDPLARFVHDDQTIESIGLSENQAQPGWAVVSGLCSGPMS